MNEERLLILAEHLEHGELGHEVFDFAQYNNSDRPICGTAGCAIGECPIAFPMHWGFNRHGAPNLIGKERCESSFLAARHFFDLDIEDTSYLFLSIEDDPRNGFLHRTATQFDVAKHIRRFVAGKK